MLQEYKTKTNIGVGLGLAMQILGRFWLDSGGQAAAVLGGVLVFGGIGVFIWGCMSHARGKGQSPFFGFLGLLSIIGLVVLVLIPDKHKSKKH